MNGNSPDELMSALAEVKKSGQCNMLDLPCVVSRMRCFGYGESAEWLRHHQDEYLEILVSEFSAWLDAHPPAPRESLARRVARETGLELIEE